VISKKVHYCWFGYNPLPESAINTGIGIGSEQGNEFYRKILTKYATMKFDLNGETVVKHNSFYIRP